MRPAVSGALALIALLLGLTACGQVPESGRDLPTAALDDAIARSIGDPTTCVVLADRATGKIVYRYGQRSNCTRNLPSCRGAAMTDAEALLKSAAAGYVASCDTEADGSRSVGWAAGKAPGNRQLDYAAMMEGQRALPGVEMRDRLEGALQRALD